MDRQWTVIRHCGWLHEALFLKSVLEGAGIDVIIPDEYISGINPGVTTASGGVQLVVPEEDARRATDLLETDAAVVPGADERGAS